MTKKKTKPASPVKRNTPATSGKREGELSPASALASFTPAEALPAGVPVNTDPEQPAGAPVPPETQHPIEPVLTAEQQAEIDQLAGRISETETLPGAEDPGQDPEHADLDAAPASFLDDASMCVDLFVMFAIEYCPPVEPLWPKDKKQKVSQALSVVFKKYNFSFARFGPEIGLLVVAGPVLYQTSKMIALHMQPPELHQARAHEAKDVTNQ